MRATVATWVQYVGMGLAMAGGAPWPQPNWGRFAAGMVVLLVGIVLGRMASKGSPEAEGHGHGEGAPRAPGSVASARAALPPMVEELAKLAEGVESMPLGELALRVEALQKDGTETVAAAQEALTRAFGFPAYASVMAPLATAERWLYRAWSAASDGHRPEARASLEQAKAPLAEAVAALAALDRPAA